MTDGYTDTQMAGCSFAELIPTSIENEGRFCFCYNITSLVMRAMLQAAFYLSLINSVDSKV